MPQLSEISPLIWSGDLRYLLELSFIQLYDYLFVNTWKYRHIFLKGTNFKKLKSYKFFYEGHTKGLQIETYNNLTYVRAARSCLDEEKAIQSCGWVLLRLWCDESCLHMSCRSWKQWSGLMQPEENSTTTLYRFFFIEARTAARTYVKLLYVLISSLRRKIDKTWAS